MKRRIYDEYGEVVEAGDVISFFYGIPPVRVEAPVVERDGKLIALTEGHKPAEAPLASLRYHVGGFYVSSCQPEEGA